MPAAIFYVIMPAGQHDLFFDLTEIEESEEDVSFKIMVGLRDIMFLHGLHFVFFICLRDDGDEEVQEDEEHEILLHHPKAPKHINNDVLART